MSGKPTLNTSFQQAHIALQQLFGKNPGNTITAPLSQDNSAPVGDISIPPDSPLSQKMILNSGGLSSPATSTYTDAIPDEALLNEMMNAEPLKSPWNMSDLKKHPWVQTALTQGDRSATFVHASPGSVSGNNPNPEASMKLSDTTGSTTTPPTKITDKTFASKAHTAIDYDEIQSAAKSSIQNNRHHAILEDLNTITTKSIEVFELYAFFALLQDTTPLKAGEKLEIIQRAHAKSEKILHTDHPSQTANLGHLNEIPPSTDLNQLITNRNILKNRILHLLHNYTIFIDALETEGVIEPTDYEHFFDLLNQITSQPNTYSTIFQGPGGASLINQIGMIYHNPATSPEIEDKVVTFIKSFLSETTTMKILATEGLLFILPPSEAALIIVEHLKSEPSDVYDYFYWLDAALHGESNKDLETTPHVPFQTYTASIHTHGTELLWEIVSHINDKKMIWNMMRAFTEHETSMAGHTKTTPEHGGRLIFVLLELWRKFGSLKTEDLVRYHQPAIQAKLKELNADSTTGNMLEEAKNYLQASNMVAEAGWELLELISKTLKAPAATTYGFESNYPEKMMSIKETWDSLTPEKRNIMTSNSNIEKFKSSESLDQFHEIFMEIAKENN